MMPADLSGCRCRLAPGSLWCRFSGGAEATASTFPDVGGGAGRPATLTRYSQASVLQYGNRTILFSIRRKPSSNSK